jgi:hypothetical protein
VSWTREKWNKYRIFKLEYLIKARGMNTKLRQKISVLLMLSGVFAVSLKMLSVFDYIDSIDSTVTKQTNLKHCGKKWSQTQ